MVKQEDGNVKNYINGGPPDRQAACGTLCGFPEEKGGTAEFRGI